MVILRSGSVTSYDSSTMSNQMSADQFALFLIEACKQTDIQKIIKDITTPNRHELADIMCMLTTYFLCSPTTIILNCLICLYFFFAPLQDSNMQTNCYCLYHLWPCPQTMLFFTTRENLMQHQKMMLPVATRATEEI